MVNPIGVRAPHACMITATTERRQLVARAPSRATRTRDASTWEQVATNGDPQRAQGPMGTAQRRSERTPGRAGRLLVVGVPRIRGSVTMARKFSGPALRRARISAGLRPEQLAVAVGRSVYSISAYERGVATPPVDVLAILADTLGVSVDDLLIARGVANVA